MSVVVSYELFETNYTIRQTVTVKNIEKEDVCLTFLSSVFVSGIGSDGLLPWHNGERFTVHYSNMSCRIDKCDKYMRCSL